MDQELHEAVCAFEETSKEVLRFWSEFASTPSKNGAHMTARDPAQWRPLQDKLQQDSKRLRDATARFFAKHA